MEQAHRGGGGAMENNGGSKVCDFGGPIMGSVGLCPNYWGPWSLARPRLSRSHEHAPFEQFLALD